MNKAKDKIHTVGEDVYHESAGGFVFYEDDVTHELYVALARLKGDRGYVIPKGHLSDNESPIDAAVREIREEISLPVIPKLIFPLNTLQYSYELPDSPARHHKKVFLFVFEVEKKCSIKPLLTEGLEEAVWVRFYEAAQNMVHDRESLLEARQVFYLHRKYAKYLSVDDVRSLTIGVPIHNGSATIESTLHSIVKALDQLPAVIKKNILICFDHCSDNSEQIVADFFDSQADDNYTYKLLHNKADKGKANTLNMILSETESELLCLVDDDVELNNLCVMNLISALVKQTDLRGVYSKWIRKTLVTKNPWKKFWHWVLGAKFDIPIYSNVVGYMRGGCILIRSSDFVFFSNNVINDDQFLQYIYYPFTKEVDESFLYFNSVTSIRDYYYRFIRIKAGTNQLTDEFTGARIAECHKVLNQKINYKNVWNSSWKLMLPFMIYRFIRIFMNKFVNYKLKNNGKYAWRRIDQG